MIRPRSPCSLCGTCLVSQDSTCLVSQDSTCPVSQDTTCLVSQDSTCLVSQDSTCLVSQDSTCLVSQDSACLVLQDSTRQACQEHRKLVISGTNMVAMARHGPILNDNEAMGARKVLKYLRVLGDAIKQIKNGCQSPTISQHGVLLRFYIIRPLTPISTCWGYHIS